MSIAQAQQITPRQLLEPFWRYLAFSALKDYIAKPKLIRLLAELMSMTIQELIIYIHSYAMPWLVLTKKRDVIQKIAEVRGEEEPWQPCLDNVNLGPILALLLVQEVPDVQEFSMALFRQISSHFDALTFVELLQVEPLVTTLELLKAAGDADEDRKSDVSPVSPILNPRELTSQKGTRGPQSDGPPDSYRSWGEEAQEISCDRQIPPAACLGSHGTVNRRNQ